MAAIRPAVAGDLDRCAELIASYESEDPADWHSRFTGYLSDPDHCFLVAEQDGAVIGYGRVQNLRDNPMEAQPPLPDGWYLSGIVVSQAHRRAGVGIRLCEARVAWVAARASGVWFFTNAQNAGSREMHKRAGFREIGRFQSSRIDGGTGVLGYRCATDV